MAPETLTEQQRKWMASVRQSLETSTGRTLAAWVEVARDCPETTPRGRQHWLKETHGLGQNYAMLVLGELARASGEKQRAPEDLAAALWCDPAATAILQRLRSAIGALPDVVHGQRKGFTSWSGRYAFAAARPLSGGKVRLGLAVAPEASPRLVEARREGWSERLKSVLILDDPDQVDGEVEALLARSRDLS